MLRKIAAIVAVLIAVAFTASADRLPGTGWGSPNYPSGNVFTYNFTSSVTAGVYLLGPAYPIATLDFEFGSDFAGILYACDTQDGGGDDDLSDDGECISLATLSTADLTVDPLKAKKLWYVLDINTAGTATLTIKGTWQQVSGGFGDVGGEETLAYILQLDELSGDSLAYEGGAKDFYFSQTTGGLLGVVGSDLNPGTREEPMISCNKMAEILNSVPGARIWVDGEDGAWVDDGGAEPAAGAHTAADACNNGIDPIVLNCDPTRGACGAISAMDPANPFTVDATNVLLKGIECDSDVPGAFLILQNVTFVDVTGTDAIDQDTYCNILAVNVDVEVDGNGSDQAFTPHSDVGGGITVIGPRSRGVVSSASTGAANAAFANGADNNYFNMIGGELRNDGGTANEDIVTMATGAIAVTLIDVSLTHDGTTAIDCIVNDSSDLGTHTLYAARTVCYSENAASLGLKVQITGTNEVNNSYLYQSAFVGPVARNGLLHGIYLENQPRLDSTSSWTMTCTDCLLDDLGGAILATADADLEGTVSVTLAGAMDEDDQTNSYITGVSAGGTTNYTTTALANTGLDASGFSLFESNSFDVCTTGTEGTARQDDCASPTITLPPGMCHVDAECYSNARTGTYYIPISGAHGLPYVIPGVTLRGFQLNLGVVGAG